MVSSGSGIDSRHSRIFLFATTFISALWLTHLAVQWAPGLFLGLKRPEREANHSPPSSVDINNAWSYTSTLPGTVFHRLVVLLNDYSVNDLAALFSASKCEIARILLQLMNPLKLVALYVHNK
jgi:hypothetical protein